MNTKLSNKFWDVNINKDVQSIILKHLLPSIEEVKEVKENKKLVLKELINGFFHSDMGNYMFVHNLKHGDFEEGHTWYDLWKNYQPCICEGCKNHGRGMGHMYVKRDPDPNDGKIYECFNTGYMCIKHYRMYMNLRKKLYPDFVRENPFLDVYKYNAWENSCEKKVIKYFGRFMNKKIDNICLL